MAFGNNIAFKIDSSKIDSTLSNFPLRLYLTSATGPDEVDFSDVFTELGDSDRKKISVMSGATECYVEIVFWDATSGKAVLDIRVPSVSDSADTELTLYYDSTESENTTYVGDTGSAAAQAVWDSDFTAVYHMSQDPSGGSGCILDSTGNENNGTPSGAMTSGDLVDGALGKAIDFDGLNDYVDTGVVGGLTAAGAHTFECQALGARDGDRALLIGNYYTSSYGAASLELRDDNKLRVYMRAGANTKDYYVNEVLADDAYNYFAHTYDNNTLDLFVDGVNRTVVKDSDQTLSGDLHDGTRSWKLAADNRATKIYADVIISEARMSSVARSDAWIKATSNGLADTLVGAATTEATDDLPATIILATYDLQDLATRTTLALSQTEDLAAHIIAYRAGLVDLPLALRLTDGTTLADLLTAMRLTDGDTAEDLATYMALVKKAPTYQAVIAQRLRSVKNGA